MTPIFRQGKKIGEIYEEKRLFLTERSEKHRFHIFKDGFGVSMNLLDHLINNKIIWFVVNYQNQDFFYCEVNDFLLHGNDYDDKGDKQLILPGDRWQRYLPYEQLKI